MSETSKRSDGTQDEAATAANRVAGRPLSQTDGRPATDRSAETEILTRLHEFAHATGALPGDDVLDWFRSRTAASLVATQTYAPADQREVTATDPG